MENEDTPSRVGSRQANPSASGLPGISAQATGAAAGAASSLPILRPFLTCVKDQGARHGQGPPHPRVLPKETKPRPESGHLTLSLIPFVTQRWQTVLEIRLGLGK